MYADVSAAAPSVPSETPEFAAIAVAMAPGNTTVTATFVSRSSANRASVSSFTAALDAPYTACPGTGAYEPMLATLTIAAAGRATRTGRKALHMFMTPQKFTFMTFSISLNGRSITLTNFWMTPAMLTIPSTCPWMPATAAGSASTAALSVMSTTCTENRSPAPASVAVSSSPCSLRSTPATDAPAARSRSATSRAMPLPAPVTTKTLFWMSMSARPFGDVKALPKPATCV